MNERVIGVDLGGTKILAGVVEPDGTVERHRETPTPVTSEADVLEALDEAVRALRDDRVVAVGFGLPSQIDQRTGTIRGSVNIPLGTLDFRGRMSDRFGLPVAIDNDANVAALAEHRAGAGRGSPTMLMFTLGTGCGGGAVIDGALYRGWAEFGHIVVEFDGLPCQGHCHGRGHLEVYVTGLAATRIAQELFGPAADSHRLVRLANEGDAEAREALAGIGHKLGAGIASMCNVFGAELVVVGGGFGVAGFDWIEPAALETAKRDALDAAGENLRIARAELGTMAGLIGAGLLAFDAA
ncbi:MAG: ROK family protein [Gaiellaceae bacterium]